MSLQEEVTMTGIYLHHKGDLFLVSAIATHYSTGEKLVVYQDMNNVTYVCPVETFSEEVDHVVNYHGMSSKEIIQDGIKEVMEATKKEHESTNDSKLVRFIRYLGL
jgi:hypothetical protein